MELTSRQRIAAFAVTVLALAALAIFLFVSGTAKKQPSSAASSPPVSSPAAAPSTPAASPTSPPPTGPATTSAPVNIYNWLPFSQQGLSRAASIVTEFSAYYGTYSWNESSGSYTSRLQGLASYQLIQTIASGYSAPGVASLRRSEKQVSSGSARIDSIRTFGSSSITFVVTVTQKLSTNHGGSTQSTQYAVTVASADASWQVNDIELASSGNT